MESRGHTPHFGAQNRPGRPGPGVPKNTTSRRGGPGGPNLPTRRRGALLINVFSGGENTGPSAVFSYRLPKNSRAAPPGGGPGNSGKFRGGLERLPGGPGGPPGGPREGGPPTPRTRLKFGEFAVAASLLHEVAPSGGNPNSILELKFR